MKLKRRITTWTSADRKCSVSTSALSSHTFKYWSIHIRDEKLAELYKTYLYSHYQTQLKDFESATQAMKVLDEIYETFNKYYPDEASECRPFKASQVQWSSVDGRYRFNRNDNGVWFSYSGVSPRDKTSDKWLTNFIYTKKLRVHSFQSREDAVKYIEDEIAYASKFWRKPFLKIKYGLFGKRDKFAL